MDGFGIQVSIKTPADSLINIRGAGPEEFDQHLSHVLEKVGEIKAAEAAFKGMVPQDLQAAAELVSAVMPGSQVMAPPDWPTTPPPPPAAAYQPPQVPQQGYQQSHCQRCGKAPTCKYCNGPCNPNPRAVKEYFIHDCAAAPQGDRTHKGQWCNSG